MKKFLVAITLFLIAALPALAQSVPLGPRFVLPYQTVVDGTGTPIPGALLYFYSSGTNIPLATYSNPLLTTPNSNPVQANAAGVFPAIFLSGNYKIVLTDASNNQIWAADPVYGVGNGGGGGQCLSITVNPQTGTSYTLQPSDNCKLVTFNNSSAIAVSLPSPATNASYQTWSATVSDIGTGTITVTPTGASFTGTGSGTNLTVTGVTGTIASGFLVTGTGVPASTTIVSQSSGTPGGAGVYVTSQATTSSGASLTAAAAINGAATLTLLPGQAAQIISDGSNYQVILSSPAGSSISVGSTVVLNGTAGRILYQNGAVIGQYPTTGTAGSVVLSTSPTIAGPTITGSLTATGLVTNADLVNPSVTVNGTACVLGASCTISSSATAVTVSGGSATTILGGSGAGHVILDNAGVLGEVSSTVTVNGTACTLGSTCAPSSAATSITVGTTTVVSGSANALLAQSTSGATVAEITTGNNQTLITNGSGVASFSTTLPTAVQGNITSTGTLTGGATGAGFTIALTTSTVTGINVVTNGGTGLATLTAGAIYKGAGTSVIAVSALSDNGTIVSSSESFDLTSHAALSEIANASSTGTTVNKLAKLSGAPSTALISATTDTGGIVGVVIGGAGTTGNAQIAVSGQATCVFDGGTTAGDYVQNSGSVAGDCTDAGATYPSARQVIGRVLATIASTGNAAIVVFPPEIEANTGGGGGSGTVTSVTLIAGTGMQLSGPCTSTTSISCTLNTPWSVSGGDVYNNNAGPIDVTGNLAVGGPSPWVDVTARAYGAVSDGTTNNATAIAAAITAAGAGGTVFFPTAAGRGYCAWPASGSVAISLTLNGVTLLFQSADTVLSTCGHDDTLLAMSGNDDQIQNGYFACYGSPSDPKFGSYGFSLPTKDCLIIQDNSTISQCSVCIINDLTVTGGANGIRNTGSNVLVQNSWVLLTYNDLYYSTVDTAGGSHGSMFASNTNFDNNWPPSCGGPAVGQTSIGTWTASHSYAACTVVSIVSANYYIENLSACTSASGSGPTGMYYRVNTTDGTCTWQLVSPVGMAAVQLDTASQENYFDQVDMTGSTTTGVLSTNTLSGTPPEHFYCRKCSPGAHIGSGANLQAGWDFNFIANEFGAGFVSSAYGILTNSNFNSSAEWIGLNVSGGWVSGNTFAISMNAGRNNTITGVNVAGGSGGGVEIATGYVTMTGNTLVGIGSGVGIQIDSSPGHVVCMGNNTTGTFTSILTGAPGSGQCSTTYNF